MLRICYQITGNTDWCKSIWASCPLQKRREDWVLAFDARISEIVWVILASFNWLTVALETMDELKLTLVTQTIPEIKSLNASAQSSRRFWSGQY